MNLIKSILQQCAVLPYLFFFVFIFLLNGCTPDDADPCIGDLPCLEGDDTNFTAALLNEIAWVSVNASSDPSLREIDAMYDSNTKGLSIVAHRLKNPHNDFISFGAITNGETGLFDATFGQSSSYRNFNAPCLDIEDGSGKYELNTSLPASLEIIDFDMESRIVSGFFSFHVKNTKPEICGDDNIAISEGRFRCSFNVFP